MEIVEITNEIYTVFYDFLIAVFQPLKELIIRLYIDNPMFKIVLAFVPAILGIAFPLIIQTVSRLYSTTYCSDHKSDFLRNFSESIFNFTSSGETKNGSAGEQPFRDILNLQE